MQNKLWIFAGSSLVALGLLLNPWLIAAWVIPEGSIEWAPLKLAIWGLNILLLLVGSTMILHKGSDLPRKLLLSSFSLIGAVLLMEGLLRMASNLFSLERPDFGRASIFYEFQRSTQYHPQWGWSFVPSIDTVWEEGWRGRERTTIRTRFRTLPIPGYPDYGMRDDGLDLGREAVIPVLGDSFTFGSTVELTETWSELIEERNPEVDMLNLASGGGLTKAVEEYRILRDRLPPHETVIYAMWLGNEFLDNYAFPTGHRRFEDLAKAHVAETQKRRIQAASYVAYVAVEAIDNVQKLLMPQQVELTYENEVEQLWDERYGNFYLYPANAILLRYAEAEYEDERILIGIQNTQAALERMSLLVEDRQLIVLLFPFKAQLHADLIALHRPELDLAKPNRIVMELCKRFEITCFDLLPHLERFREEKLFWDYDPHFTPAGQFHASLEAEALLRQLNLLPGE